MNNFQHVLILGFVWPEPDSSAAGRRMMELINLFRSEDWQVTFASPSAKSEHAADLERMDISSVEISVNNSSFDYFIKSISPTIVLFDRFIIEEQFGWRVASHCPDALRVLDTEDLHCLRRTRHKAVKQNRPFREIDLLEEEISKREIASILRSDFSLIISEKEMELLTDVFEVDSGLLHYLPFMTDGIDKSVAGKWPGFDDRSHFVTIGNFSHEPNRDSVYYLKNEIWPLVNNELPDAEMHVYGAYPTQKVWELHNPDEHFFIKGRVKDSKAAVSEARILLAPLRFGAGLKGKLLEAMQCGTPAVTTDIGAEGMGGDLAWSGAIGNKPKELASVTVELYTNKAKWEQAQKNGKDIINERFKKEKFEADLIDRLNTLAGNLEKHRRQNFIGAMLMHHTMASTKFMSRWIEAKNKN